MLKIIPSNPDARAMESVQMGAAGVPGAGAAVRYEDEPNPPYGERPDEERAITLLLAAVGILRRAELELRDLPRIDTHHTWIEGPHELASKCADEAGYVMDTIRQIQAGRMRED
jgi:hypothetical protein